MSGGGTLDVPEPRAGATGRWLLVVLAPFLLTIVGVSVVYGTIGIDAIPQVGVAVYATANVVVVAAVAWGLRDGRNAEVVRYRLPGVEAALATGGAVLVLVAVVDPIADAVATSVGAGTTTVGGVETGVGAAILVLGSLAVAPVAEEFLFRGIAVDVLRADFGTVPAVVGSSALFGAIHVLSGGISGVVSGLIAGFVYVGLRLRYETLAAPTLAHAGNNAYFVALALGLVPEAVPW